MKDTGYNKVSVVVNYVSSFSDRDVHNWFTVKKQKL